MGTIKQFARPLRIFIFLDLQKDTSLSLSLSLSSKPPNLEAFHFLEKIWR